MVDTVSNAETLRFLTDFRRKAKTYGSILNAQTRAQAESSPHFALTLQREIAMVRMHIDWRRRLSKPSNPKRRKSSNVRNVRNTGVSDSILYAATRNRPQKTQIPTTQIRRRQPESAERRIHHMRPNKLREILNGGQPSLATHIHTVWPSVVELVGHTGRYDYVEFVGEYGPYDLHDLDNLGRPPNFTTSA